MSLENACAGLSNSRGGLNIPEFKEQLKTEYRKLGYDYDSKIQKAPNRDTLHKLCVELLVKYHLIES